jgi:hypothetical protein
MSVATLEFTHQELSLLLFALEGDKAADEGPSCEEACPVADHFETLFETATAPDDKRLIHHLNTHLREGLIECGAFELMASRSSDGRELPAEEQAKLLEVNERLKNWHCEMKLEEADRQLLYHSMSRLPRSAWLTMPRALWRLKKKLKVLDK